MIDHLELGGTLFVPASHKNLDAIVNHDKYPELRSLLIDFEDGLDPKELQNAYSKVEEVLKKKTTNTFYTFLRPRDTTHLKTLLAMEDIEKIDGFILPKFSLTNAQSYLDILHDTNFYIMPSIEGKELFEYEKLLELRELLLTNKEKVVLVRFGLEDMLRQLSMKRGCSESIFDFSVTNVVLGNFLALFKSAGFAVSGGVYPCFEDKKGFIQDLRRDLKEGLFSKTIIHPNQIAVVNDCYKVEQEEYKEALEMLKNEKAIFNQNGKMAERHTMSNYAKVIVKRGDIYG
ncbi:MAG: HpcH/HpaI aldolase/citrate lyase family protein, partial [Sulfurimonas sp.]